MNLNRFEKCLAVLVRGALELEKGNLGPAEKLFGISLVLAQEVQAEAGPDLFPLALYSLSLLRFRQGWFGSGTPLTGWRACRNGVCVLSMLPSWVCSQLQSLIALAPTATCSGASVSQGRAGRSGISAGGPMYVYTMPFTSWHG